MADSQMTIDQLLPAAPSSAAPRPPAAPWGDDRPAFGEFGFGGFGGPGALNGITVLNGINATGPEAHAAVRMHVTPATGAFWSYDQKCMRVAPSSAGRLRSP